LARFLKETTPEVEPPKEGSNNNDWWVDIGVTRHVCVDKSMFYSIKAVDNGEKLYLGNSATVDIKGE
nr:hypothetical protein F511_22298 [Tanacetum cinerariifolium]